MAEIPDLENWPDVAIGFYFMRSIEIRSARHRDILLVADDAHSRLYSFGSLKRGTFRTMYGVPSSLRQVKAAATF